MSCTYCPGCPRCISPGCTYCPGCPRCTSHRLIDAEAALVAASEAEVHQDPSSTGLVALAWAQDRIERNSR